MAPPPDVNPEIFAKVQRAFCDALELEPYEVRYSSRILADLDAESLDLLDVVFRLEQAFDLQIPRGGIEAQAKDVDGEPGEVDGRLTEAGAAKLREVMPEVPPEELQAGKKTADVPEVFRVGTFYNLVVALLEQQAA